jgi:nucleoside-diphosphate-sugar epimerase
VTTNSGSERLKEAAVKRVVITSSPAAAAPPAGSAGVVSDETIWTDLPPKPIHNYARSKTLAEQDVWAYVRDNGGVELTTVLPNQIQGPVLGPDFSPSVSIIAMMLHGKLPAVPRIGWGIVDVRDVVELHLRAMNSAKAPGQRFIANSDFLWLKDVAADPAGRSARQGRKGRHPNPPQLRCTPGRSVQLRNEATRGRPGRQTTSQRSKGKADARLDAQDCA